MENYHSKLNQRYIAKLRVLELQLPQYCTHYFNAKNLAFEKQTEFAYAVDFKVFFEFIKAYMPEYQKTSIRDIPVTVFNKLSEDDVKAYTSFLENYKVGTDYRANGENGIQRKLSSLKSLCRYLLKKGMINKNPIELVDMPKIHKKAILTLTDREITKLFNTIENETGMTDHQAKYNKKCISRDYAIMMLFLGTGMRISELAGLDVSDVDLKEKTVHIIRKGGNEQHLYISDQVNEALKRYLGFGMYKYEPDTRYSFEPDPEETALFLSKRKKRLSVRAIQALIEKYSILIYGKGKNGNKLHAHLFRKTYGTNLYLDEGDIKLVADTLGHSSISTTARHYVASSEEHRRKAARDVIKKRKQNKNKSKKNFEK